MISAFGVEHSDSISKKEEKKASTGRQFTTWLAPGIHGGVAGKKGRKLRAAGTEIGATGVGMVGGSIAGALPGILTHNPKAATLGSSVGANVGYAGGAYGATNHNQRKGNYKKQSS